MIHKITSYDLLRLPANYGQTYYVTDQRLLYKDYAPDLSGRRTLPAMVLNTEHQRVNRIRPTNGVNYYVVESNCLWCYDARWVLKEGNKLYNSYVYDSNNSVSPVIIDNDEIQNEQGDRIIDNNGLMGNGTVVVRDTNRLRRGDISAMENKKLMVMTSYLDEGMLFRPYGLAQDNIDRDEIGSLKLGVKLGTWGPEGYERTSYRGEATYKGDMYVEGQLYVVISTSTYNADLFSIPEDDERIEFKIVCKTTSSNEFGEEVVKNIIQIEPVTESTAKVKVISYTVNNGIEPSGSETLIYRNGYIFDADRTVVDNSVVYKVMGSGFEIKLEPPSDGNYQPADSIAVTMSDTSYNDTTGARATMTYMKTFNVSSLVDSINTLTTKVAELETKVSQQNAQFLTQLEGIYAQQQNYKNS